VSVEGKVIRLPTDQTGLGTRIFILTIGLGIAWLVLWAIGRWLFSPIAAILPWLCFSLLVLAVAKWWQRGELNKAFVAYGDEVSTATTAWLDGHNDSVHAMRDRYDSDLDDLRSKLIATHDSEQRLLAENAALKALVEKAAERGGALVPQDLTGADETVAGDLARFLR
jgi:hypothetical protein